MKPLTQSDSGREKDIILLELFQRSGVLCDGWNNCAIITNQYYETEISSCLCDSVPERVHDQPWLGAPAVMRAAGAWAGSCQLCVTWHTAACDQPWLQRRKASAEGHHKLHKLARAELDDFL